MICLQGLHLHNFYIFNIWPSDSLNGTHSETGVHPQSLKHKFTEFSKYIWLLCGLPYCLSISFFAKNVIPNCSLDIDATTSSNGLFHYISKWVPPSCGQTEYSKLLTWHSAWFISLPTLCASDSLSSVKNGETSKCVEIWRIHGHLLKVLCFKFLSKKC